ncbi:MAG: DMT family transporter [Proteobacteria bacterium]|nr:DMT family transporter [Pseudomonadota bacterium]
MAAAVARAVRIRAIALLTLAPLFWSVNWIVGRGLADHVPPLAMTFYRWLFAIVILAPFTLPQVIRERALIVRHWRTLAALGVVGVGIHNALAYLGLRYTTATNGVILNSFIPILIVAMSRLALGERLSRMQLAGVLVSLAGVLTILSKGSPAAIVGLRFNGGDLLIVLSMAMWAAYTIGLRFRPPGMRMLSFLFVIACFGDLSVLPFYAAESALGEPMAWTPEVALAIAAVALLSSVLAYVFWNRGVEALGAGVAGLFVHLMPVFGVALAWLTLGEHLAPYHVAGIALIVAGLYATSRVAQGYAAGARP